MHNHTVSELSRLLDEKKISAVELTTHYCNRVEKYQPKLNSFITFAPQQALEMAKLSDARRSKGQALSPLDGIPMAHKDALCTKGMKTTAGSKMLADFIPSYDATVVANLNNAGAIVLGKLSMDEFAMGSSNERSYFGSVSNPWNLDYVPGGSSGGSASAVAARLVAYATGSDTGGSIRQPSSYCGISGFKPTYGTLSRYGLIAFASSLEQPGPMAIGVADLALILNAMAGHDERDSTSSDKTTTVFDKHLHRSLKGVRIGIPKSFFASLDPQLVTIIEEVAARYQSLGAQLIDVEFDCGETAIASYYIIACAEASSNLSRFDGVRYGYRCAAPKDIYDLYCRSRGEGFGEEVKRRIMIGTHVLSAGYYDAYYERARRVRHVILNSFQTAFKKVDAILTPTTPTPAFKIGGKIKDPIAMFLNDLYTVPANLAGLPAITHNVGFIDGLPVGAQLIAAHFAEPLLLNIAHQYQQQDDAHRQISPLTP